ncbi:CU044_5270 family protein [Actinoplanes sp. KI2]|uniref:CU044_5270 family protein n=1 Tax=Actinoplanes sp. KI2 TaxID=2983315 RepID=UPI0021D5CB6F|nr:CU044_5270 family protein [Actinoplanes sp. KI2]MCU7725888.1 CU044_5270 family protein [Actinoplanes sp. KI2]
MNDLDLVERFRADLPAADPTTLARARARMFRDPAPRRRGRWAWRLAPAAALAAAVALVVVASRPDAPAPAPSTGAAPAPGATPAKDTGPAPATDPAHVLRLAAAEARTEPVRTARADQFVYIESVVAWAGATGDGKYLPPIEKNRSIWLSVDGTRDGLLRESAVHPADAGNHLILGNEALPVQGKPIPAYLRNLPTTAAGMHAYLYAPDNTKRTKDTVAWTRVGDTLREQYVPPASVAALFEAAATIPGTSVVNQADLAGRKGIAVSRVDAGVRHDIIFDASTYRFLGERDVVVGPGNDPFPKGAVIGLTAQKRIAIVDRAGQLP